jgi:site-specific recombinase XerD
MNAEDATQSIEATFEQFTDYLRKKKMSDSTIKAYASDVTGFLRFSTPQSGEPDLRSIVSIRTKDLEDYLHMMARSGLQFPSVRRASFALKNFFLFLLTQGLSRDNPAACLAVRPVTEGLLSTEQIISVFQYLGRRQHSGEESDLVRYQRDELILLLMIFYGVPQYQLNTLRLSSIHTTKTSVSLIISTQSSLNLHLSVLRKLRTYLECRKSKSDTIFLESFGERPIHKMSIRQTLNELTHVLQINCTPESLRNTYAFLQQHPQTRESLIRRILYGGLNHTSGPGPNA